MAIRIEQIDRDSLNKLLATDEELKNLIGVDRSALITKLSALTPEELTALGIESLAPTDHNHDERYYTETEADTKFATKSELEQLGSGDMGTFIYDPDKDGVVVAAETANHVAWANVADKPNLLIADVHNSDDSAHGLGNGIVNTADLSFGANTINHTGKVPIFPEIEMTGMHYVNLLGKDGDCEDLNKWTLASGAFSLVTENKVFGNNCFKVNGGTANNYGDIFKPIPQFDKTKDYILSAYLLNFNSSGVRVRVFDTQSMLEVYVSSEIVDTSMRRHVARIPANTLTGTGEFTVEVVTIGDDSVYGFVDGIMLTEVPASDLALTDAQLLAKYPYVESYGALTNPYFENRKGNLVRNGNTEEGIAWWKVVPAGSAKISIESERFKIVTVGVWDGYMQMISVKPNTDYYISANLSGYAYISVKDESVTIPIRDGVGTFNSGNYTLISVSITNSSVGTGYFDSVMITEGTTAPAEYQSCDLQRFAIEGQFASDDKIIIKDGNISGLKWWKHKTLYGRDYDWAKYSAVPKGNGTILVSISQDAIKNLPAGSYLIDSYLVKYNDNVLKHKAVGSWTADDGEVYFFGTADPLASLGINVPDADSGWVEAVLPTNNEVKAFMNGWKAMYNNGSRYLWWWNVTDTSSPNNSITGYPKGTATTLSADSTGSTSITVVDISPFKVGDKVSVYGKVTTTVSSINDNILTLAASVPTTALEGNVIFRLDNGFSDTRILNFCKNNVAPNYEGYRLHYKLANPEPIIDTNVHIKGDIWSILPGNNYIMIDSGIILDESVIPQIYNNDGYYRINFRTSTGLVYGPLSYKAESINVIQHDQIYDNKWTHAIDVFANGRDRVFTAAANFNVNANYTVDYQILKTLHAQSVDNLSIKFVQDIHSSIASIAKAIEEKSHDSHYKIGKGSFLANTKSFIVRDAFITADTWIDIVPTQTKIGTWEVESYNGYFIITSDAIETSNVSFNWRGTK